MRMLDSMRRGWTAFRDPTIAREVHGTIWAIVGLEDAGVTVPRVVPLLADQPGSVLPAAGTTLALPAGMTASSWRDLRVDVQAGLVAVWDRAGQVAKPVVRRLEDGACLLTLETSVTQMAISPDGRRLATLGADSARMVAVRELPSGAVLGPPRLPVLSGTEVVWFGDSRRLAVATTGGEIVILDTATGGGQALGVTGRCLAVATDTEALFYESEGIIYRTTADGTPPVAVHAADTRLLGLAVSPDGRLAVLSCMENPLAPFGGPLVLVRLGQAGRYWRLELPQRGWSAQSGAAVGTAGWLPPVLVAESGAPLERLGGSGGR